ncbi:MAG TPA: hypothetical protein VMT53_05835 [Terriglobales bacterium]|nr:hypothetical protein [Terriglobales bacterium]
MCKLLGRDVMKVLRKMPDGDAVKHFATVRLIVSGNAAVEM